MFTVYVIENENGKTYTGYTEDLKKRLDRHNKKLPTKSTSFTAKNVGIWRVVYKEEYQTRTEATKREKELKSYQGRLFIKNVINK